MVDTNLILFVKKNKMKTFNNFNIVALGNWNKKIFSPQWTMVEIMGMDETDKIEGAFNYEEMELLYKVKDIRIAPKDNSLEISTDNLSAKQLVFSTFCKSIKLLPYTPIKGVGFNFVYSINPDEVPFLKDQIKSIEFLPKDLEVSRLSYREKADEFTLNLIAEKKEKEWLLTFNFHHSQIIPFEEDYIDKLISYIDKYFVS
jgi:hypothetical protein